MIGPLSRIAARVLSGILIGAGMASEDLILGVEPEVAEIIGVALWGATELVYIEAKKRGWVT